MAKNRTSHWAKSIEHRNNGTYLTHNKLGWMRFINGDFMGWLESAPDLTGYTCYECRVLQTLREQTK